MRNSKPLGTPNGLIRLATGLLAAAALALAPASAQDVEAFDPDEAYGSGAAIDADLAQPAQRAQPPRPTPVPSDPANDGSGFDTEFSQYAQGPAAPGEPVPQWSDPAPAAPTANAANSAQGSATTYGEDDLIGAAEGVFGKGAEGLAKLIEDLLRDQGEPNGYIVGREAGGALIFGARYGSGTLHHKIEGQRKVYWTGPSVGFDAGANAANTFVLVYNLHDTQDLYRRYPAGEGQAYFVGGLHASYMRRGDVVLIPIRMGAGIRLGLNAGYMKFSEKQRWLPF